MANSFGTETPPAPSPDQGNALTSGAMPAQSAAPAPQGGGAPQQQMPAPPTHAQTVTALRHFDAIRRELDILAKDPALGKSGVKSKVIDGVLRLVADGYMQTTQAVDELSKVPAEPLLQMKWVKSMLAQTANAERSILMHHAIGFAGGGPEPAPSKDDHGSHMGAVAAGFGGGRGGRQ